MHSRGRPLWTFKNDQTTLRLLYFFWVTDQNIHRNSWTCKYDIWGETRCVKKTKKNELTDVILRDNIQTSGLTWGQSGS